MFLQLELFPHQILPLVVTKEEEVQFVDLHQLEHALVADVGPEDGLLDALEHGERVHPVAGELLAVDVDEVGDGDLGAAEVLLLVLVDSLLVDLAGKKNYCAIFARATNLAFCVNQMLQLVVFFLSFSLYF